MDVKAAVACEAGKPLVTETLQFEGTGAAHDRPCFWMSIFVEASRRHPREQV